MEYLKAEAEELLQSIEYRELLGAYGVKADQTYLALVDRITQILHKVRAQGIQDGYSECYNDMMEGLELEKRMQMRMDRD